MKPFNKPFYTCKITNFFITGRNKDKLNKRYSKRMFGPQMKFLKNNLKVCDFVIF